MIKECSFPSPELKTPIKYTIKTKPDDLSPERVTQHMRAFKGFTRSLADKFYNDPDETMHLILKEGPKAEQLGEIGVAYINEELAFDFKEVLSLNPKSALKFIETVSSEIKQKEPQGPQQDF